MNILEARQRTLGGRILKKTVTGNPAVAQGSLARRGPGIVMQGWTKQDGTPTPETLVPIVNAGTQNQETGKWEYEVEVGCGNLINESDAIYNENYFTYKDGKFTCVSGSSTYVWFGKILSAGGYFWSVNCDEISGIGKIQVRDKSNKVLFGNTFSDPGKKNLIFTLEETTECRLLFGDNSNSAITFSKPMLNPGTTALPYTPYRPPQTVTLTADRPLTKWDRLEKRGGQWGWVYKSAEVVFDGSEKWSLYPNANVGTVFYTSLPNASLGLQTSLCDKYRNINNAWSDKYNGVFGIYSDNAFATAKYFRPPSAAVETVEQWKAWLSENPLTLWYETEVETFVPLTTAEQEAMNALHTYRPTTVLSNQQGCQMALTYKTRKGVGG